jgi:hypothetical protein
MPTNWTKFYSTANPVHASIIIAVLEENDIKTIQMNKQDSSYLNFGEIELYCEPENVITALHLITLNQNNIHANEE